MLNSTLSLENEHKILKLNCWTDWHFGIINWIRGVSSVNHLHTNLLIFINTSQIEQMTRVFEKPYVACNWFNCKVWLPFQCVTIRTCRTIDDMYQTDRHIKHRWHKKFGYNIHVVAAFRGMHVSPAKHSNAWLPRKCDYWTDAEQSDPYVLLCFACDTIMELEPQGALIAHLCTMSTSVIS